MWYEFVFDLFYVCIIDWYLSQIFFYLFLYLINSFKNIINLLETETEN